MFQTKVVEKIETHIDVPQLKKNHGVYEIMWQNMLGRPQITAHWYAQWSPMVQNRGHSPWKRTEH